ncbi:unknown_gene_8421 [Phodopus roborovskii]|uniref:Unknown_gene_8421 protein n=1 Tax=Phodopus roborovskii TaxID=109678 RepID=A0AAU9YYH9_PHORO|nr:unknown_gene_8421 [Phodopus roborovskii]
MAASKNKRLTKGRKKGAKKKVVDPFSKKDWYHMKAPAMFNIRNIGKTLVTRTQGTKIASDGLKGHVFEVSLADPQNDEVSFRKYRLITEDVQGNRCLFAASVLCWFHFFFKKKKCNNQIRKTSYT